MSLYDVSIADLTTKQKNGSGVLDALLETVELHIDAEYTKGRIRGPEYSQVYLGALQSAISQGIQFLMTKHKAGLEAELLEKQIENATKEGIVLDKQACKLDAEFDLLVAQKLKTGEETGVLSQKKITEQAQTSGVGVDADSVVGKQKALYSAQTAGFKRNAEQAAAKLMVDSWNVRRTTDEGTLADHDNKLHDTYIGQAVTKLLQGVEAV